MTMLVDKVPMIRAMREYTKCGLREAKDLVEIAVNNNQNHFRFITNDDWSSGRSVAHTDDDVRAVLRAFREFYTRCDSAFVDTKEAPIVDPELHALVGAMDKAELSAIEMAKVLDNLGRWPVADIKAAVNQANPTYPITLDVDTGWRYL